MSDNTPGPSGGGHGGLYFIVGMLVFAVAIIAYVLLGGEVPWVGGGSEVTPDAPGTGEGAGVGAGREGAGEGGTEGGSSN